MFQGSRTLFSLEKASGGNVSIAGVFNYYLNWKLTGHIATYSITQLKYLIGTNVIRRRKGERYF
jgi:hypothetical protein